MVDRTVRAVLGLESGPFIAGLAKARAAADQFSKGLDKVAAHGQQLDRISTKAGLIGAGLAVGVGLVVKSAADFDEAMSHVAATGDDARQNLDGLRASAIEAGARTAYSASQAAEGLENLAKAGVSARDSISGGLSGALDLAAAGGVSVAEAAETAATAMTQFGLSGREVPHVADVIAAAAGKAQGGVTDMANALKYVGPVAHQMGVSLEETAGSVALLASQGVLGSQAGTSLRGMLTSLTSPSKLAAKTMKELGINVYDASGKFVGFRGIASQLQASMGTLSAAERDQALGRIFGNEQITAARILYSGGAEAVDKWTNAVNDSGYAQEAAATRMNNLKGDLEKLRGSFESALIETGEGSQGALRALAKGADGAVNSFSQLSSSSKQATLLGGAVAAAGLLGFAGLTKLATSAASARESFRLLSTEFPRAATGISRMGRALGVATALYVAFIAAGQAGNALVKGPMTEGIEDVTNALLKLQQTSDKTSLNGIFSTEEVQPFTHGSHNLVQGVSSVDTALDRMFNKNWQEKFSDFGASLLGWTGAVSDMDRLTGAFDQIDQSLAGLVDEGKLDTAAAGFNEIRKSAEQRGIGIEKLLPLMDGYKAKLAEQANQLGVVINSDQEWADWMGGKIPDAIKRAQDAAGETSVFAQAQAALGQIASDAAAGAQSLDELSNSLFDVGNAALQVSGSEIGFQAAIDAATESIKTNKQTLDTHTEAGRANKTALDRIAASGMAYVENLTAQGASTKKIVGATQDARDAFIKTAQSMGLSKDAAKALADKYGLIPKDVKTKVEAEAEQSKVELQKVKNAIKDLPKKVQTQVLSAFERGGIDAANAALAAINGKTATTYVRTVYSSTKQTGADKLGVPGSHAEGGLVRGPGTTTSDSIPTLLSDREFVQRAAAVDYYGVGFMHALNNMQISKQALGLAQGGQVRRFASGGVAEGAINKYALRLVDPAAEIHAAERAVAAARREKQRADSHKERVKAEKDLIAAHKKLADAQKQFADQAKQAAATLMGAYDTKSTDPFDILARKREGASDLTSFDKRLDMLRKLGLDPTLMREIIERGAKDGNEIAQQILDQGRKMVDSLNDAQKKLRRAATAVGYDDSVLKRAGGGPIDYGPSGIDKVRVLATRGEFMMQNLAVDYYGLGAMRAINDRKIPKRYLSDTGRQPAYQTERAWPARMSGSSSTQIIRDRTMQVIFNGQVGASADDVVSLMSTRMSLAIAADGAEYSG